MLLKIRSSVFSFKLNWTDFGVITITIIINTVRKAEALRRTIFGSGKVHVNSSCCSSHTHCADWNQLHVLNATETLNPREHASYYIPYVLWSTKGRHKSTYHMLSELINDSQRVVQPHISSRDTKINQSHDDRQLCFSMCPFSVATHI